MVCADYIVGLTDGEGCFYVNISERNKLKNPKAHVAVKSHFYIKLREDDLSILKEIKSFLGFGFIYFQKENRENHSSCYRYEVNSIEDKAMLIDFFNKHPLHSPKKKKDFRIFCLVTKMVMNRDHFTSKGISKIRQLKSGMH